MKHKPQVVISVGGGLVQDVFCSEPDTQVLLVDWDTDGMDLDAPGAVEIKDQDGRSQVAVVAEPEVLPLGQLRGSDVQAALVAAGVLDAQM